MLPWLLETVSLSTNNPERKKNVSHSQIANECGLQIDAKWNCSVLFKWLFANKFLQLSPNSVQKEQPLQYYPLHLPCAWSWQDWICFGRMWCSLSGRCFCLLQSMSGVPWYLGRWRLLCPKEPCTLCCNQNWNWKEKKSLSLGLDFSQVHKFQGGENDEMWWCVHVKWDLHVRFEKYMGWLVLNICVSRGKGFCE